MPVIPFSIHTPNIAPTTFVAPSAWITGAVTTEEDVTILFGAVLRGDLEPIRIGKGSNIQDNAVLHTTHLFRECFVGPGVTVGHSAVLHSCAIERDCIIGMGATVLDGAEVGPECLIGAQTLVPIGMKIPPRSLVVGVPGRVVRELKDSEIEQIYDTARRYQEVGREYTRVLGRGF